MFNVTQVSITSSHVIPQISKAFRSRLRVCLLVPKTRRYERIDLIVLSNMVPGNSRLSSFSLPYFSVFPLCFPRLFTQALNLSHSSDKVVYLFLLRKEHSPVAMSHCVCTSGPKFSLFL